MKLLIDLGGYPAGTKMDIAEFWADILLASGYAEPVLAEATVTVHDDGHRVLDLWMSDSVMLEDH